MCALRVLLLGCVLVMLLSIQRADAQASSSSGAVAPVSSSSGAAAPTFVGSATCYNKTTSATCRAAGCYFDLWQSADGKQGCYDSASQVVDTNGLPYTCAHWALPGILNPEEACSAHSCMPFGGQCLNLYNQATPYGLPGAIAVTNIAQWDSVLQVCAAAPLLRSVLLRVCVSHGCCLIVCVFPDSRNG